MQQHSFLDCSFALFEQYSVNQKYFGKLPFRKASFQSDLTNCVILCEYDGIWYQIIQNCGRAAQSCGALVSIFHPNILWVSKKSWNDQLRRCWIGFKVAFLFIIVLVDHAELANWVISPITNKQIFIFVNTNASCFTKLSFVSYPIFETRLIWITRNRWNLFCQNVELSNAIIERIAKIQDIWIYSRKSHSRWEIQSDISSNSIFEPDLTRFSTEGWNLKSCIHFVTLFASIESLVLSYFLIGARFLIMNRRNVDLFDHMIPIFTHKKQVLVLMYCDSTGAIKMTALVSILTSLLLCFLFVSGNCGHHFFSEINHSNTMVCKVAKKTDRFVWNNTDSRWLVESHIIEIPIFQTFFSNFSNGSRFRDVDPILWVFEPYLTNNGVAWIANE